MKTSTRNLVVVAIVAAVVGSVFSTMANSVISRNDEITDTCISQDNSAIMRVVQGRSLETDFTKAAESTVNAVVSIKSYVTPRRQQYYQSFDPFEFFFGPGNGNRQQPQQQEQKPQQSGLGSGVIISNDGYIVTNNHVVDGAEKLEVTLNDNRSFNAQVIGTDATTDLALLKIEAKDLSPIPFGDSDDIKVGEWVLAVGNPFGFTSTVTAGIVSAKARSISSATHSMPMGVESFIQTAAAVNPGNSGGALVTTDGLLVGINTAIYSTTGNYAGYSFAIPSNIVKKVITDIKQYGTVQRAVLGISFQDLTAEIAKERDITAVTDGIIIEQVLDRGSAKEAGLEKGDVIIKINDAKIKDKGTMMEQMSRFRPGDKIKVTYVRDNKTQITTITLKNSQGNTSITKSNDILDLGCAFKELSDNQKKDLGISKGVEVLGVKDGKFKEYGIRNGFIILDINNYPVSSREDVEKVYKAIMNDNDSDKVMFITGIYPTGKKVYYAVPLVD